MRTSGSCRKRASVGVALSPVARLHERIKHELSFDFWGEYSVSVLSSLRLSCTPNHWVMVAREGGLRPWPNLQSRIHSWPCALNFARNQKAGR